MPRVLVLRHGDDIPLGILGEVLEERRVAVDEVWLHAGQTIPPLEGYDGLVVLGGEMGAYDEERFPWLVDEKAAIRRAHGAGLPTFGICLGSQLIADALGGSAYLADSPPEIGVVEPALTVEAAEDPVLRHLDRPVVAFHQDTWDPPPGATVLARSDTYNHAFRLGSAVAVQSHPEATTGIVEEWTTHDGARALMDRAGIDGEELLHTIRRSEPIRREMSRRLFNAWVDEMIGLVRAPSGAIRP